MLFDRAGRSPVLDSRSTPRTPRCTLRRGEPFKLTANPRRLSTTSCRDKCLPRFRSACPLFHSDSEQRDAAASPPARDRSAMRAAVRPPSGVVQNSKDRLEVVSDPSKLSRFLGSGVSNVAHGGADLARRRTAPTGGATDWISNRTGKMQIFPNRQIFRGWLLTQMQENYPAALFLATTVPSSLFIPEDGVSRK